MLKRPLTILGINPGSKYLGIAVFRGSELRDWGIKVIKGKWSRQKLEKILKIIAGFIEQYKPQALAIKKIHPSRSSSNLDNLVLKIKTLSKRKGLKVYQYSIKELESFFSQDERINKKKLADIIASEYPALFNELNREKSHKNPYHIRMFEAVALGSVCFHQLDKKYAK
jgi:Holliday junction resolvasome RuvABC endonuclease subunit